MVAIIAILAAIAIPQFSKYRAMAQQKAVESAGEAPAAADVPLEVRAAMDGTLESLSTAAKNYHAAKTGWPCTLEELNFPEISTYAQQQGWELEVNCQQTLGAIVYNMDGKKLYRAIYFETGEIEDGVL